MYRRQRIAVMDSSSLLACLQTFTDTHAPSLHALSVMTKPGAQGEPPLDAIYIPDHVLYELTGILPISFPRMQATLAQAATQGDAALREVIELYTQASPRGDRNDPEGKIKNHVRALLYYISQHPDALVSTSAGEEFCKRLKADYAMLCASGGEQLAHYRPTFVDAFHHLGDAFHASDLRVHIGQLMMMGLITESEYNDRMGEEEKEGGRKKRFLLLGGMLDRLSGKRLHDGDDALEPDIVQGAGHEREFLTKHARKVIEESEAQRFEQIKKDKRERKSVKNYLTLEFFERYPAILEASDRDYRKKQREPIKRGSIEHSRPDAERMRQAIGPSPLLIEHYCYGGVLPKSNPALLAIAGALGIDTQGLKANDEKYDVRQALHARGFFEISPTMMQLWAIQAALAAQSIEAPQLAKFVTALEKAPGAMHQQFVAACKPTALGGSDLPYEKTFAHALINQSLSWEEGVRILTAEGMLRQDPSGMRIGEETTVLLDPQSQEVLIRASAITRRGKPWSVSYLAKPLEQHEVGEQHILYYRIPAQELVARCWCERIQPARYPKQLTPVLEALFSPLAMRDASRLRDVAVQVIGEDRLVQIEKDYANRHARKHLEGAPPYRDILAALHTNSRITRKNLGEIATLQAAQSIACAQSDAAIWVINHDSDLFPNASRKPQLEASLVRQHAGLLRGLGALNHWADGKPDLHFLNTRQFLETIATANGHDPAIAATWANRHGRTNPGQKQRPSFGVLDKLCVRGDDPSWAESVFQKAVTQR